MPARRYFFPGLFCVCMATLMLQIVQTRILSVVSMYYLAFLSISMAMLGMTAGALVVHFKLARITPANLASYLSRLATAFALAIALCFLVQIASPLPMVPNATLVLLWLKLILLLAAPFTVAGIAVSLALTRSPFPVGIVYGVDLLGAAFGCLVVLLLLNVVDAPSAMFVIAALSGLGACCFQRAGGESSAGIFPDWRILRRPGAIALALLVLAGANSLTRRGIQPISAKFGSIQVGNSYEFERWNSFSRVLAAPSRNSRPQLWGPSPAFPADITTDQRLMNIDGFAGTTMPRFDGDLRTVEFLRYDITNLACFARPTGRVAIIGVGSGRDVLSARLFGAREIVGVELNPIFIDLLNDPRKLRRYAGVADLAGVRLVVDDGRSWFARTSERFDLIQMSMIDTFAATGAGAFSLSENGLYTVEGWRIFLSALEPDGLFTVSRWHAPAAPVEIGRITGLALDALFSLGVPHPREHLFIATIHNLATLIVSRSPLTAEDLRRLRAACDDLRFNVLAAPDRAAADPIFEDLLSAPNRPALAERTQRYQLDLSPPTDARPFFFNQLRLFDLRNWRFVLDQFHATNRVARGESLVVVGNLAAVGTLFLLILISFAAVITTVVAPARPSICHVERPLVWLGSTYFLLIGLGFMFIEIGLIQRMSVFVGQPIYALGIVLFSIILSSGLGSLLSERLPLTRAAGVIAWLALLVGYVWALPRWLPALAPVESAGLLVRAAVTVAAILPAGLLLGFGFPTGMRLVMRRDARPTPWFWGVNGAAGVLSAGLAVACSLAFSIDVTLRTGAFYYALLAPTALGLLALSRRSGPVVETGAAPAPVTP